MTANCFSKCSYSSLSTCQLHILLVCDKTCPACLASRHTTAAATEQAGVKQQDTTESNPSTPVAATPFIPKVHTVFLSTHNGGGQAMRPVPQALWQHFSC